VRLLLLVAVTGLLLLGVNVVVGNALPQRIRINGRSAAGAKLRPMIYSKDIRVGDFPEEYYELVSVGNVLSQPFANGNDLLRRCSIRLQRRRERNWRTGKYGAAPDFIVSMPDFKLSDLHTFTFKQDGGNKVAAYSPSWSFPAILNLGIDRYKAAIQWKGGWDWNRYPSPLIDSHGFTHVASLNRGSEQEEASDKQREILNPRWQRVWHIAWYSLHIIIFFIAGLFLAKHFMMDVDSGRRVRSLLFLLLMLASAWHVMDCVFKLGDAWSNQLW
jgi:hypothetical protein